MPTATITFRTDTDESDTLDINVEFDPEFRNTEGSENPICHVAAMISLQAVTEALAETA